MRKPKFEVGQVVFCEELACKRPVKLHALRQHERDERLPNCWYDEIGEIHYEAHLRRLTKRERAA